MGPSHASAFTRGHFQRPLRCFSCCCCCSLVLLRLRLLLLLCSDPRALPSLLVCDCSSARAPTLHLFAIRASSTSIFPRRALIKSP